MGEGDMELFWQECGRECDRASHDGGALQFLSKFPSAENGEVRAGAWLTALAVAAWIAMPAGAAQSAPTPPHSAPTAAERVDINHAGVAELEKVPGLTRSWAERIVRFRPYWTKQELLDRGVVTSQVYDRIKNFIVARRQPQ
jgi:DNA uptake protein ComE-like DNA-binding protein